MQDEEEKQANNPLIAGDPEDRIPFAWRYPILLTGKKKVSKVLKTITEAESERAELVPQGLVEE